MKYFKVVGYYHGNQVEKSRRKSVSCLGLGYMSLVRIFFRVFGWNVLLELRTCWNRCGACEPSSNFSINRILNKLTIFYGLVHSLL